MSVPLADRPRLFVAAARRLELLSRFVRLRELLNLR